MSADQARPRMTGEEALLRALFELLEDEKRQAEAAILALDRRNAAQAAISALVDRVFYRAGPRAIAILEATGRDAPRPASLIGPAAEPLQTDKEKDRSACSQP